MANTVYPLYKQAALEGDVNVGLVAGTVKIALVDTAVYTYSAAHQFLSDLSGVVGTAVEIPATKTCINGTFDGPDISFLAVTGASVEALVIYVDTGVAGTSRLVAYLDTLTGLPVTPNTGDINVTWDAAGIFTI